MRKKKIAVAITSLVIVSVGAVGVVQHFVLPKKNANASKLEATEYEEILPLVEEFSKGYAKAYAENIVENVDLLLNTLFEGSFSKFIFEYARNNGISKAERMEMLRIANDKMFM